MSANFTPLIAATAAFVLGHFVMSSMPIRTALMVPLGQKGFLAVYSLYAIGTFIWMNIAYTRAPFEDLWGDPHWARWVSVLVMPLAAVLFAAGAATAHPWAVRVGNQPDQGREPRGIQKVTRHPVLWAIAIWAALHLAANGDQASLIFFGGILALCLIGVAHMEARKRAEGGAAWEGFAARSSVIPFAALVSGRAKVTLSEIGWGRLAAGLILYFILLFGHRVVIDVPLLPQLAG
ncbi:MAG TPA: NnrU family protein [Alphaproteobacteria bacterium]|nr:NnrU family protein [Alphaproteobacteria bacterium]